MRDLYGPVKSENRGWMAGNAPDEESPWCGGDVGLLSVVVDGAGTCDGVDVGPEEEEVNEDVYDLKPVRWWRGENGVELYLEKEPVCPGAVGRHCGRVGCLCGKW